MRCIECGSAAVTERPERTTQGYRRFRCRQCGKQFNERSNTVLNRAQYPSDVIALVVLWRLYRMTGAGARAGDSMRIVALGLAFGGAAGNLVDRFRSPQGVIDFIDIGLGDVRFWTFNLADSAVTVGALALAWSLSREERESAAAKTAAERAVAQSMDAPPGVSGTRE